MEEGPTFIVAGAQKSGTTWLFECFDEHPEIFVPSSKEVHYFCPSTECRFSAKSHGHDWYKSRFPRNNHVKAYGDLTTDYMYYPGLAEDIYQFNSRLKIIFVLRNPVDRAYSAYWMWRRHNPDLPPFREMISKGQSLVARGFYYGQIKSYVDLFGWSQIKVVIYEELFKDPEIFLEELFKFIDVDVSFRPKTTHKLVGDTKQYPDGIGNAVYKVGSKVINWKLILPAWRWLRRNTNIKESLLSVAGFSSDGSSSYHPMDEDDRDHLESLYREENEKLCTLLDRDASLWKFRTA